MNFEFQREYKQALLQPRIVLDNASVILDDMGL